MCEERIVKLARTLGIESDTTNDPAAEILIAMDSESFRIAGPAQRNYEASYLESVFMERDLL